MRRNTNRHGSSDASLKAGQGSAKLVGILLQCDSLSPGNKNRTFPETLSTERVLCSLSGGVVSRHASQRGSLETPAPEISVNTCPIKHRQSRYRVQLPNKAPSVRFRPSSVAELAQPHHSENKDRKSDSVAVWESNGCRPSGEGTEQGQTDLLNRDLRNQAVLTRPLKQPRVGLVKPSPVRQAVKLLPRRIAECWKQHGYRQRDHLLSTNTRYFPLNGGSSAVFKPLSTQDHSLPTNLRQANYLQQKG